MVVSEEQLPLRFTVERTKMPIAKSEPQIEKGEIKPESQTKLVNQDDTLCYGNIPVDMFRYFSIDMGKVGNRDLKYLDDITAHARKSCAEGSSIGDILAYIGKIERGLSPTHFSESRLAKLWNWVKLSDNIVDLEKRREALEGRVYV